MFSSFFFILNANAQITNSIAKTVTINNIPDGREDVNGMIVVLDKGNYSISNTKADSNQVGVITFNPAITLRKSSDPNTYDVNVSGVAQVRASNSNGRIPKGSYVTSSNTPGVAVLSTESEFVIGIALEDFDTEQGLLRIEVDPRYNLLNASTGSNLINVIRNSSSSFFLAPVDSLRYFLASIVVIASFLFGFSIFGKITGSGIQALARNPLARRSIQINIIVEFVLNIAIIIFGLVVAYFILTI
jgi:F0F1-type ATP synthase membrane subunit c/vacuolar-type H+-ATPase subunit K